LENSVNPAQPDTSPAQPKTFPATVANKPLSSAFFAELHQEAQRLFAQQISANTKRAYLADWLLLIHLRINKTIF